jgi:squalene-associated FAD-dependent desaturase
MISQRNAKPIVIVGGGVAGLAAGTKLAQAKLPVCVLEAGPALGGRARSFIDQTTCDAVDNGQHALMGCYDEFLALLERVGQTNALTEGAPRIPLWSAERGIHALDCPRLPAPLHFAVGLLRYRQLSVRERLSVALAGHRLVNQPQGDATVSEMLDAAGQNARQRNAFWDPVVWATLNAPPNQASAALLAAVVQRALMGSYDESRFLLPRVPLSELYADPACKFIEERGGEVRCRTRVDEIDTEGGLCVRSQGEKLPAAAVILAVPPVALSRIGPAKLHPDPALHAVTPIVSTTLWLDRPLKDEVPDFLGLVESETHWLFRVDRLHAAKREDSSTAQDGERIACVRSGATDWAQMPRPEIAERVWRDVQRAIPSCKETQVSHSLVVKELAATLSPEPQLQALRPGLETGIPGVWRAGDWTNTGLPATLESAALSGHRAADQCLRELQ